MSALARMPMGRDDVEFDMLMTLSGYGLEPLDLERTFDGLIAWPAGPRFGDLTANERRALLAGVCERLIETNDNRLIRPETYAAIVETAGADFWPKYGSAAWMVVGLGVFFDRLDVERTGA